MYLSDRTNRACVSELRIETIKDWTSDGIDIFQAILYQVEFLKKQLTKQDVYIEALQRRLCMTQDEIDTARAPIFNKEEK